MSEQQENDPVEETIRPPPPPRITSGWRAIRALTPALEMLAANPDLVGDRLAIALASEAPDVLDLLDALVATIKYREAWVAVCRKHANEIAATAKRDEAAAEKLRELLCDAMQQLKLKRHRSQDGMASLMKRKGRVIITSLDDLPNILKKVETVVTPDKRAIADALDVGNDVSGAVRGNAYITVKIE